MTETQIVEFLQRNAAFFTTNNIVITVLRIVGWMLVKGVCALINICKELYDRAFGIIDITKWSGLEDFLGEFEPLLMAFMFLSIVVLGFLYLFGKNKKHNVLTSILIFGVVVTSSNYLFTQLNLWTVTFKDAVVGAEGTTDGAGLVKISLFDLIYIDGQMGLENLSESQVSQYRTLSKEELDYIDISEVVDYNQDGLSEKARDILKKRLLFKSAGETGLLDVSGGVAWTDFGNTFYYRYTFQFGTFFLNALAVLLIYICLAYKSVRIIYEIFVSRILATLKSADLSSSKKTVVTLECIRDGYYALCFTAITLRSYFLFGDYLSGQAEMSGIVRAILMLFVAFCVVDGANVMQKLTGVDAGLSSMSGKLIAGYHMIRGGMQTVQQARQFHMMKQQRDAMKQMKEGGTEKGATGQEGNAANRFQTMEESMEGEGGTHAQPEESSQNQQREGATAANGSEEQPSDNGEGTDRTEADTDNAFQDMDGQGSMEQPFGDAAEQFQETMDGAQSDIYAEQAAADGSSFHAPDAEHIQQMNQKSEQNNQGRQGNKEDGRYAKSGHMTGGQSRFEGDETKNMFDRWNEKSQRGTGLAKTDRYTAPGTHTGTGAPKSNYAKKETNDTYVKNTKGESRGVPSPSKPDVKHITEEKIGKDRYVGGDGGGEGKQKR